MPNNQASEKIFKAKIVHLLLSKDTQEALELVSKRHGIAKPRLKVGMPKGYSKKVACYVANNRTIHVSSREALYNPHVILHEFYHHLRNSTSTQKGLEKHANRFAEEYLRAYEMVVAFRSFESEIKD